MHIPCLIFVHVCVSLFCYSVLMSLVKLTSLLSYANKEFNLVSWILLSIHWMLAILMALLLVRWFILKINSHHRLIENWTLWGWYYSLFDFGGIHSVGGDKSFILFRGRFYNLEHLCFAAVILNLNSVYTSDLRRVLSTRFRGHFQHATSQDHYLTVLGRRTFL